MSITIGVNGINESISVNKSVFELLTDKSLDPARVVVEVNRAIVKKNQFMEYFLQDGDSVEILQFVGGG